MGASPGINERPTHLMSCMGFQMKMIGDPGLNSAMLRYLKDTHEAEIVAIKKATDATSESFPRFSRSTT